MLRPAALTEDDHEFLTAVVSLVSPLSDGADWGGLGLLYGVSAVLLAIAVVALNKRDVGI